MPPAVLERAREILANLEAQALDLDEKPKLAGPRARRARRRDVQMLLFAPEADALRQELRALNLEQMTPIEALAKLEEFKKRAGKS